MIFLYNLKYLLLNRYDLSMHRVALSKKNKTNQNYMELHMN